MNPLSSWDRSRKSISAQTMKSFRRGQMLLENDWRTVLSSAFLEMENGENMNKAKWRKQGQQWIVSVWDDKANCYRELSPMTYQMAKACIGECRKEEKRRNKK